MQRIFYTFLCLSLFALKLAAQDECGSAPTLNLSSSNSCSAVHFSIDVSAATVSTTTPMPTCAIWGAGKEDVWVKFIVPAGVTQMNLALGKGGGGVNKPVMAVYRGTCAALTQMSCYEAPAGFLDLDCRGFSFKTITVTPGETIFLRIADRTNSNVVFDLIISTTTAAPVNNTCANATPLGPVGCNVNATGGSNVATGGMRAPESCTGFGSQGATWNTVDNIVFYTFQVTASTIQPVSITLNNVRCAGGCNNIQLAMYSSTCAQIGGSNGSATINNITYRGCEDGTGTVTITSRVNLPPGTYYLAVDGCSACLTGGVQTSACIFGITSDVINVPLPLNITKFKSKYLETGIVELFWEGENMDGTNYFIIERSSNGVDFEEIGEVFRANGQEQFLYYDKNLNKVYEGHLYYRIRQVDFDGMTYLTDVNAVEIKNIANTIVIAPNPVKQGQPIFVKGDYHSGENIRILIYNSLGALIWQSERSADEGSIYMELPASLLDAGVYTLVIGAGDNALQRKIVVY